MRMRRAGGGTQRRPDWAGTSLSTAREGASAMQARPELLPPRGGEGRGRGGRTLHPVTTEPALLDAGPHPPGPRAHTSSSLRTRVLSRTGAPGSRACSGRPQQTSRWPPEHRVQPGAGSHVLSEQHASGRRPGRWSGREMDWPRGQGLLLPAWATTTPTPHAFPPLWSSRGRALC